MSTDPAEHELNTHEAYNRADWDDYSDEYQARHGDDLAESGGLAWERRRSPNPSCASSATSPARTSSSSAAAPRSGRSRWPRLGARPVGLDLSERQLEHARRLMAEAGVDFPLVHASAEAVPLPDASFDVVFCDHGAMSFADPYRTVPEVARLLRPGGLFAFSHHSPIETICWPLDAEEVGDRLRSTTSGCIAIDDGEEVSFQLPYGEWIRLFRANGFVIEDLIEPRPPAGRDQLATATAASWPGPGAGRPRRSGGCAEREGAGFST